MHFERLLLCLENPVLTADIFYLAIPQPSSLSAGHGMWHVTCASSTNGWSCGRVTTPWPQSAQGSTWLLTSTVILVVVASSQGSEKKAWWDAEQCQQPQKLQLICHGHSIPFHIPVFSFSPGSENGRHPGSTRLRPLPVREVSFIPLLAPFSPRFFPFSKYEQVTPVSEKHFYLT